MYFEHQATQRKQQNKINGFSHNDSFWLSWAVIVAKQYCAIVKATQPY
jgi:hypothetical protein